MDISVYTITHRFNQRFYLGYSQETEKRFQSHRNMLRRGAHHCIHLQRAWDKDGEAAFEFRRLAVCVTVAEAIDQEQMFLDAYFDRMYNSVSTNDKAVAIRKAHNRESIARSAIARKDSMAVRAALARNRVLAMTPQAQAKRIATTRANDTACAGQRVAVRSISEMTGTVTEFRSMAEAARRIGSSRGNVHMCCNGLRPSVKGHLLSYAEVAA